MGPIDFPLRTCALVSAGPAHRQPLSLQPIWSACRGCASLRCGKKAAELPHGALDLHLLLAFSAAASAHCWLHGKAATVCMDAAVLVGLLKLKHTQSKLSAYSSRSSDFQSAASTK